MTDDTGIALRAIISQNTSGGLVATYEAVRAAYRMGERTGMERAAMICDEHPEEWTEDFGPGLNIASEAIRAEAAKLKEGKAQ